MEVSCSMQNSKKKLTGASSGASLGLASINLAQILRICGARSDIFAISFLVSRLAHRNIGQYGSSSV